MSQSSAPGPSFAFGSAANTSSSSAPSFGGFGANPSSASSASSFGFALGGASTGGSPLFGSSSSTTSNVFGSSSTPASNIFGSSSGGAPTSSLFGSLSSGTGQTANPFSSTPAPSTPAPSSPFGASTVFGSSNIFGSGAPTPSLFSSSSSAAAASNTSTPLSGSGASATPSFFGSITPTSTTATTAPAFGNTGQFGALSTPTSTTAPTTPQFGFSTAASDGGESAPLMGSAPAARDSRPGIPQLFTSVPSLNDAAAYIAETTSIFTGCFPDISIPHVSEAPQAQELTAFASEESRSLIDNKNGSSSGIELSAFKYDAPVVHGAITRGSAGESSRTSNALVPAYTNLNGTSLFQGLVEKVRRTVRGSADDIGWLQKDPDMPPVEEGTERFTEILDEIRHGVHRLPNTMVYLLVPGLFSNHGPLYFVNTKTSFSKMGLTCHIAKIHSEASVSKNAKEIKDYVEELYWGSQKRVLLLGHSKGGIDAAAALSIYWDELKDKVAGLALAQSPYGGSPIASDILREGQLGDYVNMRKLMEILICKVIKGDMQALEDLTYEKRKAFLRKYQLPRELPVVSFHTEARISPAVLATLSRVSHAEMPMFSGQPATLPVVIPLGAAMAACAQLLQIRYGEKSDGLVTCRDAEVPGSIVVRPKRKLDHAWMVYSSLNDDPSEADASQVCEALLRMVVEGKEKMKDESAKKDE